MLEPRVLLTSAGALATFDGSDGAAPCAGLIVSGNNLYGTTTQGGAFNDGTVFSVPITGGTPTVLASFNGADGETPCAGLAISGGLLYGIASSNSSNGDGTIFSLSVEGGTPTVLGFIGGTSGIVNDQPGLIVSGNTLYGAAEFGGTDAAGDVFSLPATGGTPTILATFNGSTNGDKPQGNLLLSNNTLYGTTFFGGAFDDGEVFSVPVTGGGATVLASFNSASDGGNPQGGLVLSNGVLYGTTSAGASNGVGGVFSLPVSGGTPTPLAAFTDAVEADPLGTLVVSGTTLYGAADSIYSVPIAGGTPTILVSITALQSETGGVTPNGVILSGDALYGTTQNGGNGGLSDGVVFDVPSIPNMTGAALSLTTPATAASVDVGQSYTIDWTGGNSTDTVQLWAEGGPNTSWTELTAGVPQTAGSYTWNTTGVDHGWYHFQAWDIPTSGSAYAVQSPNWLHIIDTSATAPVASLSNPPLSTDSVAQGTSYTLNFTASDGTGDSNPIYVQLWVYSGNTGLWTELSGAGYIAATQGSYVMSTTGMAPGWYSFSINATNGDQWSSAASPGWLNITVPTPVFTFQTPTSGQTVAAGGTFNLDWGITGLTTADIDNSTAQIWAQHLVNGSPVWSEIAASVSASGGTYAWTVPTSPGSGTYYAFSVWLNYGNMWWDNVSPNWVQVN